MTRVNILGVGIDAIDLPAAVRTIGGWIAARERHYVNVCVVHTIMECRRAPALQAIVNGSGLAVPDGMPLVWLARREPGTTVGRVYGPDLMLALCEAGIAPGYRHFFYGGAPGVAEQLANALSRRFPGLVVAGTHTPPLRPADVEEDAAVIDAINAAKPDIIWVGLGTPKQDYWVARHRPRLDAAALIAVGAAFDFHTGRIKQAPKWMQRSGLEWLFRLWQEPRRLAYRYLMYNPMFVGLVIGQRLGLARRD